MVSEAYVPILDAGQGKAKAILSFSEVHVASLFSFQPNIAWISFASEQQHSPTFYQTSHQQPEPDPDPAFQVLTNAYIHPQCRKQKCITESTKCSLQKAN
jgi:hypothetical protein